MDSDFHDLDPEKRDQPGKCKGVCIGNNVFIGANVTVLKGAKIGNNSVIASGSIVTGHIPDNTVAAGNPCKIIRSL
jgi:maltose O-acetyltransferase